jgi:cytochrome b
MPASPEFARIMPADQTAVSAVKVRVWDLPTRLFHWCLVTGIFVAWASWRYSEVIGDYTLKVHRWTGMLILVLLVFRVIWGVVGSSTSRLSRLFFAPWTSFGYAIATLRGPARHYLGHNPLGSYMILALLAAVALQATLGLFTVEHNDVTAGPLYRLVSEPTREAISHWHGRWFYRALLVLIPLHILANIGYGLIKRDPLIRAMITGRKPAADYVDAPEAEITPSANVKALICLAVAAALVFGTIFGLGGKML